MKFKPFVIFTCACSSFVNLVSNKSSLYVGFYTCVSGMHNGARCFSIYGYQCSQQSRTCWTFARGCEGCAAWASFLYGVVNQHIKIPGTTWYNLVQPGLAIKMVKGRRSALMMAFPNKKCIRCANRKKNLMLGFAICLFGHLFAGLAILLFGHLLV